MAIIWPCGTSEVLTLSNLCGPLRSVSFLNSVHSGQNDKNATHSKIKDLIFLRSEETIYIQWVYIVCVHRNISCFWIKSTWIPLEFIALRISAYHVENSLRLHQRRHSFEYRWDYDSDRLILSPLKRRWAHKLPLRKLFFALLLLCNKQRRMIDKLS